MQILLYDDEQMRVFEVMRFFPQPAEYTELDVATIEDIYANRVVIPNHTYTAEITTGEVKAELDPTTMKRIARYNLEKDFEGLNQKIKSAEDKLKDLNKQVIGKEAKLEFMGEMVQKIWRDACFDPDNYLPEDEDYCEGD